MTRLGQAESRLNTSHAILEMKQGEEVESSNTTVVL